MSFSAFETSVFHGEPVNLFLFTYGPAPSEYYAYCDAEDTIIVDTKEYVPIPIDRDAINSSGTLDKSGLSVAVDGFAEVAELFRVYPPSQPVSLVIRQGHIGDADSEFGVIWTGRVLSCRWEDNIATLTCEPVSTSMQRTGLRRHYQYGCPHALYMGTAAGGCRANKAAATKMTVAQAITGSLVTLPAGWNGSFEKSKFINGLIEWTNGVGSVVRRAILRVNEATNVITIGGPIPEMDQGDSIAVILGCNHQMTDCADIHNNINDFGGQPYIPTKNPFGNTQNYY